MKKDCAHCGKLRTDGCTRPDYCVGHGFCDYAKARPWDRCPECGSKMYTLRTDLPSTSTVITDMVCRECGLRGEDRREFVRKAPARV